MGQCVCYSNSNILIIDVCVYSYEIRVITTLTCSEQSYKGKVKTHKYINRQNQSKS